MKEEKILITGASGFIGTALCRLFDRSSVSYYSHRDFGLDVTRPETFKHIDASRLTYVVHLAGKTFVPDSWKDPAEFLRVNTLGTQHVAAFCREHDLRLVYVSAYIYGNTRQNPIGEEHPLNVNNPYALSKKMGEEVCLFYRQIHQLPVTIIRPFNVYGPGQNKQFLIPEILDQVEAGDVIRIRDLSPKRDFIYVDDVARIILRAIQTHTEGIFNAGTGRSHSVAELIQVIQKVFQTNLKVISADSARSNEISDTVADITRAKELLGWYPEFDLEGGIRKIKEGLPSNSR
jgi:nucleoside-diphosphate-sugar epimerase